MYRIVCDNEFPLYDPLDKELVLTEPVLNRELSKAGSLSFTISPTHPYYSKIIKMQSIISVYQDDELIFKGRVFSDKVNFNKMKTVEVEGLLAYFNDSIVRPYHFFGSVEEYLEFLISQHNQQVSTKQWFQLGEIDDPDEIIMCSSTQFPNTWNEIEEKLIGRRGRNLTVSYLRNQIYINYLKKSTTASQKIEFAVNLLDLEDTTSGENLATCIIPYGAVIESEENAENGGGAADKGEVLENEFKSKIEQRVDITSVNDGVDYICDEEAVEKFGKIYEVVYWDDITNPSYLLKKAKDYLLSKTLIKSNLTIKAIDLHLSDEEIEAFRLGDSIEVYSKPHELEEYMLLKSYSLTLNDPTSFVFTLEETRNSFVGSQVSSERKTSAAIGQLLLSQKRSENTVNTRIGQLEKRIQELESKQK